MQLEKLFYIFIKDEDKADEFLAYLMDLDVKPLYLDKRDSERDVYYITLYIDKYKMIALRCSNNKYIEVRQNIVKEKKVKKYEVLDEEFFTKLADIMKG